MTLSDAALLVSALGADEEGAAGLGDDTEGFEAGEDLSLSFWDALPDAATGVADGDDVGGPFGSGFSAAEGLRESGGVRLSTCSETVEAVGAPGSPAAAGGSCPVLLAGA